MFIQEEKMTDKLFSGRIEKFGKDGIKTKNGRPYLTIFLGNEENKYGHQIIEPEDKLKKIQDKVGLGTEIEFMKNQNGEFWNYVQGSLKIKNLVPVTVSAIPTPNKDKANVDIRDRRIVRQNAGTQANSMMMLLQKEGKFKGKEEAEIITKFVMFAEEFESWVFRDEAPEEPEKPEKPKEALKEPIKGVEAEIVRMEEVEDII